MSAVDTLIEAREAAVRELSKLFPTPETLSKIGGIRSEYAQKLHATEAQLSTSVTNQVEQARSGIEALSNAQYSIDKLRENFFMIEKLCTECDELIVNHDQIKQLSTLRNNLHITVKDVEGMLSISTEATEARASLGDARELVNTYERLTALEGKRRFALAAASSRPDEAQKLREYFEDVNKTKVTFEQTLFGYIRDFFRLAKDSPQTLVRALRVVEMQEILEKQLKEEAESEGENSQLPLSKSEKASYKDRCFENVAAGVSERFSELLNKFVFEDLKAALDEATAISNDLPDIYNHVATCFPSSYKIFDEVVQQYNFHFVEMLQKLSDRAKDISNIEILRLVGWINTFEKQMLQLGVDETTATILAECGNLEPLIDEYIHRMETSMKGWLGNVLSIDKSQAPRPRENGRLYTPVAIDVFRLLEEQVQIVEDNSNHLMLFKTAQSLIRIMLDFQDQERLRLQESVQDVGLESLCAMVNNNVKCHDLAVNLGDSIIDYLEIKYSEQLDFSEAVNGFSEVAKEAAQQTVEFIFSDNGVKDLISKLYQRDWHDKMVTEYLVATLDDYFGDIKVYLEERTFRRFAEVCLEQTVVVYIDHLLSQKGFIKEVMIERMKLDEDLLSAFFKEHISATNLQKRIQPMSDLRELSTANSNESFTIGYQKLLQNFPDCPPEVVEKLVNLREEVPKKEAREIVQVCRDIYRTHTSRFGEPKVGLLFSRLPILTRRP